MNSLISLKTTIGLAACSIIAMLSACAKPGLDLAELPLPAAPKPILEAYEHKLDMAMADFSTYKSKDKRLMWYAGQQLSGSMVDNEDKKNRFFAANYATFYVEKAGGQITAYEIHTETRDKTALLEAALQEQFGKPDYFYRDPDFSARVWERGGKFFFFDTNNTTAVMGEKTRTADLMVVSSKSPALLEWFASGGGFSYYGDYLDERAKPEHQGKPYRYADFFRDEEAEAKSWGQEHSRYFDEYVAE